MRTPSTASILLASLCIATWAAWHEYRVQPDGITHVYVLDVGQGDSIFIVGPQGQHIIVDGGPDRSTLAAIGRKMSFFDRRIDALILTHPHLDHVASFPAVLQRYDIQLVVLTGVQADAPPYQKMMEILREKQIPVLIADPTKDIHFGGGLTLDTLWPPPIYAGSETEKNLNDTSVVTMLRYGNDSMLLTGDMEQEEEYELLATGEDIHADILKVGHHGSRTSTSTGFLLAVQPSIAVISAGKENPFGHPHASTIERLRLFGIETRVTAWEGTIALEMDGY